MREDSMNELNITRLVDMARLRPFQVWLTFWCLLAMMVDGFDLLNASIAGPAIIKEWGISRAALGPVFSPAWLAFWSARHSSGIWVTASAVAWLSSPACSLLASA